MRIVTHNVYWFQGCPSRWGCERVAEVAEVFDALCDLYTSLRPDVLCLQEVHDAKLVGLLADRLALGYWLHAPGGARPDYGAAILSRLPGRLCDRTRLSNRPHERTHVRAGIDTPDGPLELAAVHLPSNRYAGTPAGGERARIHELEQIIKLPPRPDVMLGDMNSKAGSQTCRRVEQAGYTDAATARPPGSPQGRVEYVWLGPGPAGRLRSYRCITDGAFERHDSTGVWKLSDHPILFVELE